MTRSLDQFTDLITGANKAELICLLSVAHVITGKEIKSIAEAPKETLGQAVTLLRETQLHHPEMPEFEDAIQYIQQAMRGGKENKT